MSLGPRMEPFAIWIWIALMSKSLVSSNPTVEHFLWSPCIRCYGCCGRSLQKIIRPTKGHYPLPTSIRPDYGFGTARIGNIFFYPYAQHQPILGKNTALTVIRGLNRIDQFMMSVVPQLRGFVWPAMLELKK